MQRVSIRQAAGKSEAGEADIAGAVEEAFPGDEVEMFGVVGPILPFDAAAGEERGAAGEALRRAARCCPVLCRPLRSPVPCCATGAVGQCAALPAARAETRAVNDLELVPTEANGNVFRLFWKGSAVAAAQVNVVTADGWTRVLRAEADGSVKLPTSVPGLYVLDVSVKINGSVSIDGKQYDDVRHTTTLSFTVEPAACK